MRVSAKVDYAVRAAVELAAAPEGRLLTAQRISEAQDIPHRFLDHILAELRHAGIVESRRGPEGGHRLHQPAADITLADVIRPIDGPLASVGGRRPDQLELSGTAEPLREVWIAVRAALRGVLEHVTLADLASGQLPAAVVGLAGDEDAWAPRMR